jgi:glycosyltransferase involved in cell wall biosynthesis
VVDDGSEDGTPGIVRGVPRLKYIRHEQSLGQPAAENRGIKEASGDWIKPLDDDDLLMPDCLEKMTVAIEKAQAKGSNPVIISGRAANVDQAGRELSRTRSIAPFSAMLQSRDQLRLMLFDLSPIGTPVQVAFEREAALRCGGWNEHRPFRHPHGNEIETWIKLAARGECLFIPSIIAHRTIWSGNTENSISPEERYVSSIYLKELIAAELGQKVPGTVKSFLALHWGLVAARNGSYDQAARLGLRFLRQPLSLLNLLRKRASKKAMKFVVPLERTPAIGGEDTKILETLFATPAEAGTPRPT